MRLGLRDLGVSGFRGLVYLWILVGLGVYWVRV